jgi:hypothetical protein
LLFRDLKLRYQDVVLKERKLYEYELFVVLNGLRVEKNKLYLSVVLHLAWLHVHPV